MTYTLGEITQIINGQLKGDKNFEIDTLLYDSRRIIPSFKSLFFALRGRRDGHDFVQDMIDRGVKAFVVNKPIPSQQKVNFILVKDTLKALQNLATFHRSRLNIPVIAITGSNGKTIVKDWTARLMNQYINVAASPRSFNSQIGVPLSVWEIQPQHQIAILEAGISRPGEMARLERIIRPTIGIFTILGDAHQENFSSFEQKLLEKLRLFEHTGTIIYPRLDPLVYQTIERLYPDRQLITWSSDKNLKADLKIISAQKNSNTTKITGLYHNTHTISITIPFTDRASIHNAITTWLTLLTILGLEKTQKLNFRSLPQIEMRLQQVRGIRDTIIINDSYNCDFTSLQIALDYLAQQSPALRKTLILSDIEQTGYSPEELYQRLSMLITNSPINRFIGVGQNMVKYSHLFHNIDSHFFLSTDQLLNNIETLGFRKEIILLKGARSFRFERIARRLQQKTHRTVLEIDMNALRHNLSYFRSLLKPNTRIMVMVKAFSYGSGSHEIASLLQAERVDYLGVAIADEGVELREAGITLPIIVMNPDAHSIDLFPEYSLEPEIYSMRILEALYSQLKDHLHHPLPVHIKINTGMNRLGFDPGQIDHLIARLHEYRDTLRVRSVFSHLVASPEEQFDQFTIKQLEQFKHLAHRFKQEFGNEVIAHVLNSGGIERFNDYQMDMVRLGIGLYGISAVDNNRLRQIGTLKTHISQLRRVPAGQSIGYSRAQFTTRDSVIAILPIGYADGLDRRLSQGRGKVLIRGRLAPIIGNICMDMTMVDVTDIPGVQEDDQVIIFGPQLPITQVAEWMNTIPYEVLTSISHRVKRIYTWE